MSAQREMTLAEWCEQLHDGHRVNRELRELTARAEAAEQRVREVGEELRSLHKSMSVSFKGDGGMQVSADMLWRLIEVNDL